jgi:hydroxyacylglutathione hydrolase
MLQVVTIDAGGDANRAYCILDPENRAAWCVDPSYAGAEVLAAASGAGCPLTDVFLTHTHGDHIASVGDLAVRPGVRIWCHSAEVHRVPKATPLPGEGPIPGIAAVEAIFTPGHTPGGVCYRAGDALFTGDTLFVDWVGRADFQGGDPLRLFESLRKLRALPGHLVIHPGHHYGRRETRTLEEEIRLNKFLACTDYGHFLSLLPELSE